MSAAIAAGPKRIVIFADGTGNAFSTQESNVWRLYQALDKSQGDQITHYIKGVGTSGFRPFAILDGATGIGVPANVRKLYEFICWNWNPGDQISMFGFSRGSFTIRTLIGLIDHEGLVPRAIGGETVSRHEMHRNVMAAWRSYRSKTVSNNPLRVSPLVPIVRCLRNIFVGTFHGLLRHRSYGLVREETANQKRSEILIKFAGLFDTVEAFGVPIEEFRRAIDWAIWPISFSNARLSSKVERAYHALSLDDERTTFRPLRFDVRQERTDRIREVWFAGVHSDVGGGYPDADLEHVPLVWMAERAVGQAGIQFTAGALAGFRAAASPVGPRHDSRNGLGVFYRYGPRVIVDDADDGGPPVIHHSVAERMVFGCDGYAPIVLPSTAEVLLPDGSKHTIRGFAQEKRVAFAPPNPAMARALDAVAAIRDPDPYIVTLVRDHVWWRRVAYFALLGFTIFLGLLPFIVAPFTALAKRTGDSGASALGAAPLWKDVWDAIVAVAGAFQAVLTGVLALVGSAIPGYAKPWVDGLTTWPIPFLLAVAAVLILYRLNGYLRDRIADLARQAWFPSRREKALTTRAKPADPKRSFATIMRTSVLTNLVERSVASFLLPAVGVLAFYIVVFVTVARTLVSVSEGHGDLCKETPDAQRQHLVPGQAFLVKQNFETRNPCWASGVLLEKGHVYTLRLKMEEPYFDSPMMSDIAGFTDSSWRHLLGVPFRRWWSADWFQPVARIGAYGDQQWKLESIIGDTALPAGTDRVGNVFDGHFFTDPDFASRRAEIRKNHEQDPGEFSGAYRISDKDMPLASKIWAKHEFQNEYVSEFAARDSGELFLYVNDVLLATPWAPITYYYANNRGTATVTVLSHDNPPAD